MSRLPVDPSTQVNPSPPLPYKSHPIFHLRKATILIASIGFVIGLIASSSYYDGQWCATSMLFLGLGAFVAFCDLNRWAQKKAHNPDDDPKWPLKSIMAADMILALILFFLTWGTMATAEFGYDYHLPNAYTALADLLCSLLHAYSFWKELKAYFENKVKARLLKTPCNRCGYLEDFTQAPTPPPNTFSYAGPSAENVPADSAMEEGLLIGSDFSSSYGTIEEHIETPLEQPVEVVITKGKKKRGGK